MWGEKMIYMGVEHRDFIKNGERTGMIFDSLVIEDYIASERTFKFIYYDNDLDIFILEQENLFPLIKDIKEMEIYHEELCIKKGKESLTLLELERMRRFFTKVLKDTYFYWKEFAIVEKVEVDLEMINI